MDSRSGDKIWFKVGVKTCNQVTSIESPYSGGLGISGIIAGLKSLSALTLDVGIIHHPKIWPILIRALEMNGGHSADSLRGKMI